MSTAEPEVPEVTGAREIALPRPARSRLLAGAALGLAGVAGGVSGISGAGADRARVWTDLLVDDVFFLSLALAGALFVAIHYLARAGWWVAIRRVPEAMMAAVPVAGALALALYFGLPDLYPWARPAAVARDPLLAGKSGYLNPAGFLARTLLFVGVWTLLATLLRRASLAQDRNPDLAHHRRLVRLSAVFVAAFAVTFSLASFEWLMSLDPHWYSTIFAVYTFAGLLLSGIAAITVSVVVLARREPLAGAVNPCHLHDLGKLLFAFSTFWAYIWVSQYLLIWYSNIPEEATFYVARLQGGFRLPFFLVPGLEWMVPFVVLMPRAAKRNPKVLLGVSTVVLVGHWLDLYLLVAPPVLGGMRLGMTELLITAGYAVVFLLVAGRALAVAPLLAKNDPYLAESLRHDQ
jgi:hypothetical protein